MLPGAVGMHELIHEVVGLGGMNEQAIDPHILRADGASSDSRCGMGGISRRIDRARADMAEAAGHADAIGADRLLSL